jgi:hypothetical protein
MTWTTEEVTDNVHRVQFDDISAGWEQYVLITADRHHDNKHSDHKLEKRHLDLAIERNAPIIDIGDLFCAMQGRYDQRKSQDALRPEHRTEDYFGALLDTSEAFYKPYADNFVVMGHGNHETSILKHNNLDLTKMLANRLSRHSTRTVYKGGYGGYVIFQFWLNKTRRHSMRLKYYHGTGGGGVVTRGVIQTNRRAVMFPDADIIATGHIHEAWIVNTPRERCSRYGVVSLKNQVHLSVPTYKEEYNGGKGGYHVERGRPPKPLGCAWLKFSYQREAVKWSVELDLA